MLVLDFLQFLRVLSTLYCFLLGVPLDSPAGYVPEKIPPNPEIKIGIITHFGSSPKDKIQISSTNAGDYLELSYLTPEDANRSNPALPTEKFRLIANLEKITLHTEDLPSDQRNENDRQQVLEIASFRTYEQTLHWFQILEKKMRSPDWELKIVYARPWSVRAYGNNLERLKIKLKEFGFSAKLMPKPNQKTLTLVMESGACFKSGFLRIKSAQSAPIRVDGRRYAGIIELIPDSLGTYTVVNKLPLEEYLRGVVPFEIGADAPTEALKVQAILARTYSIANMDRFKSDNYHLCASQECQVYQGLSGVNSAIDQAIHSTEGIVLKSKRKNVAEVFYYSGDGGYSANFSDIWPASEEEQDYLGLKGVPTCLKLPKSFDLRSEEDAREFLTSDNVSAWDCLDDIKQNHRFRWRRVFSQALLSREMIQANARWKFGWKDFSLVEGLTVLDRSATGRVLSLAVKTDHGPIILNLDEMRAALGGLPSTFFVVSYDKGKSQFIFDGAGFGHGVGLSQYGAINLASRGKNVNEILKLYFPVYEIERL